MIEELQSQAFQGPPTPVVLSRQVQGVRQFIKTCSSVTSQQQEQSDERRERLEALLVLAELVLDYRRSSSRRGLLCERLGRGDAHRVGGVCGCHAQLVLERPRRSCFASRCGHVSRQSYTRLYSVGE